MSTMKLRVSQEGNLHLPEDLLLEMGIGPGDEVLVVGSESRLLVGQGGSARVWNLEARNGVPLYMGLGLTVGTIQNDRIIVLVSDGIESCGGDPVQAARSLREQGIIVHLIGFGLGSAADEDSASLRAIANASGGRYVTASNAEELQAALAQTVATSFSVYRGVTEVASGSLGSADVMLLPEGEYRVEFHSSPPVQATVRLAPRDQLTLTLEKFGNEVSPVEQRGELPHTRCDDPAPYNRMLGATEE